MNSCCVLLLHRQASKVSSSSTASGALASWKIFVKIKLDASWWSGSPFNPFSAGPFISGSPLLLDSHRFLTKRRCWDRISVSIAQRRCHRWCERQWSSPVNLHQSPTSRMGQAMPPATATTSVSMICYQRSEEGYRGCLSAVVMPRPFCAPSAATVPSPLNGARIAASRPVQTAAFECRLQPDVDTQFKFRG